MKNRRGFTLIEMMCVVAIIIFLSAVTITGFTQYTKRAKDMKASVEAHSAAYVSQENQIRSLLMTTRAQIQHPTTDTQPHYNQTQPTTPPTQPTAAPTQPTAAPTQPTTPPTQPTEPTTQPTTAPTTAPTTPPTQPTQPQNNNTNAPGSSVQMKSGWWDSKLKFNKGVTEAIIRTDGTGFAVNANGKYNVENLGGGRYKVKFVAQGWGQTEKNIPFHVDNANTFVIESFS